MAIRVFSTFMLTISLALSHDHLFWSNDAAEELLKSLRKPRITSRAKNVILFIGDGMDIVSTTLGGHLKTQLMRERTGQKVKGRQLKLAFEEFPYSGLSRTYTVDRLVPDSAGTGTALLTGSKTNNHVLGFDSAVKAGHCSTVNDRSRLESFILLARKAGRSAGVVTTTRITHATPASTYAQSASRFWENDRHRNKGVPKVLRHQCPDIATQLVSRGIDVNVFLGGGRREFLPRSTNRKGQRVQDDLIQKWKHEQRKRNRRYQYINSGADLRSLNAKNVDYLLGLFSWSHMDFEVDRVKDGKKQPSLSEMTASAISILSRNPKGYVMMVEGGRIDHAHHQNKAQLAITDLLAFDRAVEAAVKMTNISDTLIIVTADHGHTINFGGYIHRGTNIFGLADTNLEGKGPGIARDDLPYTSILYGNGPSAPVNEAREGASKSEVKSRQYMYESAVPMHHETHGGQHVAVFARGPMAHLIQSLHEQNYIVHVAMYAGCIGRYANVSGCRSTNYKSFM